MDHWCCDRLPTYVKLWYFGLNNWFFIKRTGIGKRSFTALFFGRTFAATDFTLLYFITSKWCAFRQLGRNLFILKRYLFKMGSLFQFYLISSIICLIVKRFYSLTSSLGHSNFRRNIQVFIFKRLFIIIKRKVCLFFSIKLRSKLLVFFI